MLLCVKILNLESLLQIDRGWRLWYSSLKGGPQQRERPGWGGAGGRKVGLDTQAACQVCADSPQGCHCSEACPQSGAKFKDT